LAQKLRQAFNRETSIVKIHHDILLFCWDPNKKPGFATPRFCYGYITVPYGSHNLCESEKNPWSLVSLILPLDSSVRDTAAAL